ncbi:MAG: hypothetical protein IJ850_06900 [Alistipes sp.]|nr:hypothetical protein [Alistipes sp.]
MPTVAGDICVPWRPVKRGCELRLAVPGETTACVSVPGSSPPITKPENTRMSIERSSRLFCSAAAPDAMTGVAAIPAGYDRYVRSENIYRYIDSI